MSIDKKQLLSVLEEKLSLAIDFWMKNSRDTEYGGIAHCLDRDGKHFGTDKGVWMQGRTGWAFSYLYNHVKKDPEFLDFAKSCIKFAAEKCTDKNGRMYNVVTRDGLPVEKTGEFFSEAFFVMANAEHYIATGEREYLETARRYYDLITEIHKNPAADPNKFTDNQAPIVRRLRPFNRPMILLNLTALMAEADCERLSLYNENSLSLFTEISEFYRPEYSATLEAIGVDGSPVLASSNTRVTNPGHDMECAWFLLEEGIRLGNTEMTNLARTMFDNAYRIGLDPEYGGFVYLRDVLGGPIENYEYETKVWWVHNEAVIASLALYLHTGMPEYAEKFNYAIDYSLSNFVDTDGEWYYALHRDGTPISSRMKGFIYKGPFHTIRMYVKCIEMLKKLSD